MREPIEPKSSNHIIQLTGNTNGRQYGIICRTNLFGLDSTNSCSWKQISQTWKQTIHKKLTHLQIVARLVKDSYLACLVQWEAELVQQSRQL